MKLLSRLKETKKSLRIPLCCDFNLDSGHVYEFTGADESGKEELLMTIIAQCILPKLLSGCESSAILITSNKLDIFTVVKAVDRKMVNVPNKQTLCESILDNFYLFSCDTAADCYMALLSVYQCPSRYGEVAAVIIDNFNNLLFEGKTKTARSNCADILSKLTQEHELVMVLSQFSQTATDGHVLKSLQKLVDCKFRLTVSRDDRQGSVTIINQIFPDNSKSYVIG